MKLPACDICLAEGRPLTIAPIRRTVPGDVRGQTIKYDCCDACAKNPDYKNKGYDWSLNMLVNSEAAYNAVIRQARTAGKAALAH